MQNESRTGFEPLPKYIQERLDGARVTMVEHEKIAEIVRECPRPTLYIGEVVEVKGMSFEVIRIKADGKIGLKMVPKPYTESAAPNGPRR